jgi:putative flippase GtrA
VIERVRDNLNSTVGVIDERKLDARPRNGAGTLPPTARRWLKFNAVGALGIAVQLVVLLGLRTGFHFSYLLATALAVEAAVVHNFLWHERYTWADRVQPSWRKSLPRLLRFNLTTGGVSIAGNLALMKVMVGRSHLNYLLANGVAIALCSLVNFLVCEGWVFENAGRDRPKKCRVRLAVRRE